MHNLVKGIFFFFYICCVYFKDQINAREAVSTRQNQQR